MPAFTCVCLRFYAVTQERPVCAYVFENIACVRKKCLLLGVANVLLLRSGAGYRGGTLASKCAELFENAAIVRKATCVCLHLSVAASCSEAQECKVDLWSA